MHMQLNQSLEHVDYIVIACASHSGVVFIVYNYNDVVTNSYYDLHYFLWPVLKLIYLARLLKLVPSSIFLSNFFSVVGTSLILELTVSEH